MFFVIFSSCCSFQIFRAAFSDTLYYWLDKSNRGEPNIDNVVCYYHYNDYIYDNKFVLSLWEKEGSQREEKEVLQCS